MSHHCNVVHSRDCDGQTNTECFRCGLPACGSCSVVMSYRSYGRKRIGLDCLDEMARLGELDYLVVDPPPPGMNIESLAFTTTIDMANYRGRARQLVAAVEAAILDRDLEPGTYQVTIVPKP